MFFKNSLCTTLALICAIQPLPNVGAMLCQLLTICIGNFMTFFGGNFGRKTNLEYIFLMYGYVFNHATHDRWKGLTSCSPRSPDTEFASAPLTTFSTPSAAQHAA